MEARAITATVVRAVGVAVVGITAFTLLVFTSPVWAGTTYYATSCADLSKIYSNPATMAGDAIVLPPGTLTNCNFGTGDPAKAVKITGSGTPASGTCGVDNTGLQVPGSCGAATSGGTTIIINQGSPIWDVHEPSSGILEISNITFENPLG